MTEETMINEQAALAELADALEDKLNYTNVDIKVTNPAKATPRNITVIEEDINKGIVIKDSKDNEWVWVVVPKTIYTDETYTVANEDREDKNVTSAEDYEGIFNVLNEYAKDYRKGGEKQNIYCKDEWYDFYGTKWDGNEEYSKITYITNSTTYNEVKTHYGKIYIKNGENYEEDETGAYASGTEYYAKVTQEFLTDTTGCGLTYDEYNRNYKKMLGSIYTNGGFWIGRYEGGIAGSKEDSTKTSSLLYGLQWNLVCKFLEETGSKNSNTQSTLTKADIKSNSVSWGNYKNNGITLSSGKYSINPSTPTPTWKKYTEVEEGYIVNSKIETNVNVLITTGSSENTKVMNIYDFAGNLWEWTLQTPPAMDNGPCIIRGGAYDSITNFVPVSNFANAKIKSAFSTYGLRPTLY